MLISRTRQPLQAPEAAAGPHTRCHIASSVLQLLMHKACRLHPARTSCCAVIDCLIDVHIDSLFPTLDSRFQINTDLEQFIRQRMQEAGFYDKSGGYH